MFGKPLASYLAFQRVFLVLLVVVGLLRLGLSLSGAVPILLLWGVASLVMLIAKRIVRRPVPV